MTSSIGDQERLLILSSVEWPDFFPWSVELLLSSAVSHLHVTYFKCYDQ